MRFRNILAAPFVFCLAMHAHAGDWITDQNKCKAWNPNPLPGESIRWSGSCLRGFAAGSGTQIWSIDGNETGDKYEGQMRGGKYHGKGVFTWKNGRYSGDHVDGKRTGKGVYTSPEGHRYEGDFVEGRFAGKGVFTWPNGDRYEGDFRDGRRTGKGLYTWPSGSRYTGDFVEGKFHGKGTLVWPDGTRYDGDFAGDRFSGNGVKRYPNGAIEQGVWRDGTLVQSVQSPGRGTSTASNAREDEDYRSRREEIEERRNDFIRCKNSCTDKFAACGFGSVMGSLASLAAGAPVTSNVSRCEGESAECEAECASDYGSESDYRSAMRDLDRSRQNAEHERMSNEANVSLHQGAQRALRDAERYKEEQRERALEQQRRQMELQAAANQQRERDRQVQIASTQRQADERRRQEAELRRAEEQRRQDEEKRRADEQRRQQEQQEKAKKSCPRIDDRYIQAKITRNTGQAACGPGEYHLYLTNNYNVRAVCNFALEDQNGTWSEGRDGIGAGRRASGFWTCSGTGRYRFSCYAQPDWQSDMFCP